MGVVGVRTLEGLSLKLDPVSGRLEAIRRKITAYF
jgi:predicted aspartyl protease